MKVAKTISAKALAANRKNAQKSTGPHKAGKLIARFNALRHGLLAKRLIFQSPEEEKVFERLLDQLGKDLKPKSALENMLVEEIGLCWWKLQVATRWELQETANRPKASKQLLQALIDNCRDSNLSIPLDPNDPTESVGWDCREAVLKTAGRKLESSSLGDDYADRSEEGGHAEMELRLASSMDTIMRYQTTIKRDLYRAIQTLRNLQD